MSSLLATTAIELGKNGIVLDSYWKYSQKNQSWFFSTNPTILGATSRPNSFKDVNDWRRLNQYQRSTLLDLADSNLDAIELDYISTELFEKLYFAYMHLWPYNLYSVFWDVPDNAGALVSSAFLGDTIFRLNAYNFTNVSGYYFDANAILNLETSLRKREKYTEVSVGDIVCFNRKQIEIITKISKHASSPHRFCSVGAGRGFSPYSNAADGVERCDSYLHSRELAHENNQYFCL